VIAGAPVAGVMGDRRTLASDQERRGRARIITFDQHLPKTTSGKIVRRLLRARELGIPEGDVSTLEEAP
jgi:acetyl-CoA synthetase